MEQGIATSEGTNQRTYILLALNILGVVGCVCNMIMLTLWALGLIFPEPDIAAPIWNHIQSMRKSNTNMSIWRMASRNSILLDALADDYV